MAYLFKLEWLKQKNFSVFKTMLVLYIVALPGLFLVAKTINIEGEDMPPFLPSIDHLFMFPAVWEWLAYVGNWLSFFFLGFLGVLMVTNEHRNKTLRQNIITGVSRKQYYFSKLTFIIGLCLGATLYYTLCCLVFGFLHNESIYLSTITKDSQFIFRFFLMALGYMSFGFLLGMLIKRTGIALLLYITYVMVIESILRGIHYYFFEHVTMNWYPLNAIEDLAPFPVFRLADPFIEEKGFDTCLSATEAILLSSFYIVIFLFFSYRLLKKADL